MPRPKRVPGWGVRKSGPRGSKQPVCCHRSQWFGLAGAHRVLQVCGREISLGKLTKLCSLHGSWDFIPRVLEGFPARGSVVALGLGGWNDHSPCLRPLVWHGVPQVAMLLALGKAGPMGGNPSPCVTFTVEGSYLLWLTQGSGP